MVKNDYNVPEFDIIEFAKNILNEVEKIRSYDGSFTDEGNGKANNKIIESRLNAFFRLVGLPMFLTVERKEDDKKLKNDLSGEKSLTPGYYPGKYAKYNLKNSKKFDIELKERETELLKTENTIGSDEMNKAMTQSLKYSIPVLPQIKGIVGPSGNVFQSSVILQNQRKVFKSLFPLATSYIDINPVKNEVARPFMTYIKDFMPDGQTNFTKPLIEIIIRLRMITMTNSESEINKRELNYLFEALSSATNDSTLLNDDLSLIEALILERFIASLDQIAERLYKLQIKQELLHQDGNYEISINTQSAQNNMFGKRVGTSASFVINPESKYGRMLNSLQKKLAKEQAVALLLQNDTNNNAIIQDTVFSGLISSFSQLLSPNLKNTEDQIAKINEMVEKNTQLMEKMRVELELITGEFTGLSIIDIISVIIALFIIPKNFLISLLDNDVIDDLKKDKVFNDAINSLALVQADVSIAILEDYVNSVFTLFNYLLKNKISKSSRPKDPSNPKVEKDGGGDF